jgi:hypothetical protein
MLQQQVKSALGVALGVFLFAVTYRFLQDHILGSPDPLTILLLLIAAASRNRALAVCVFLSGLSHFSLTAVAVVAMAPLQALIRPTDESVYRQATIMAAALLACKLFLIGWYWFFDYQLFSRWDFIFDKGIHHFWNLFKDDPIAFLYIPGRIFGLASVLMMTYLLFKRSYGAVLAYCFALFMTYAVLFITLDGLRIFSVMIVGPYFIFLTLFLNRLFTNQPKQSDHIDSSASGAT